MATRTDPRLELENKRLTEENTKLKAEVARLKNVINTIASSRHGR